MSAEIIIFPGVRRERLERPAAPVSFAEIWAEHTEMVARLRRDRRLAELPSDVNE